nr:hypothetical protein [Moraxella sp. CTOTU47616]
MSTLRLSMQPPLLAYRLARCRVGATMTATSLSTLNHAEVLYFIKQESYMDSYSA